MLYKILTGSTTSELEVLVKDYIGRGWKPHGSLAIGIPSLVSAGVSSEVSKNTLVNATEYGNNLIFCQAMIKT